jgi:hypothetical protein
VLSACVCIAQAPAPGPRNTEAVVVSSGSTNTSGFRIRIELSGEAAYTNVPRRLAPPALNDSAVPLRAMLPGPLIRRFFDDLTAAGPLSDLPRSHCMKSASFGTTLIIEFDGNTTPDLRCPATDNPHLQALKKDADDIIRVFRPN